MIIGWKTTGEGYMKTPSINRLILRRRAHSFGRGKRDRVLFGVPSARRKTAQLKGLLDVDVFVPHWRRAGRGRSAPRLRAGFRAAGAGARWSAARGSTRRAAGTDESRPHPDAG